MEKPPQKTKEDLGPEIPLFGDNQELEKKPIEILDTRTDDQIREDYLRKTGNNEPLDEREEKLRLKDRIGLIEENKKETRRTYDKGYGYGDINK